MAASRTARATLAVLVASAALAEIHAYRLPAVLPLRVASHFDAFGRADGWMSRDAFVAGYAILVACMTLVLVGSGASIARRPDAQIKLPHRDYWLHPSRREATLDWLRGWLHLLGAGVNLLLIRVMQLVVRANLDGTGRIDPAIGWLVIVFVAGTLSMVAWMHLRFRRPPA